MVDRSELLGALDAVKPAVGGDSLIRAYGHFWFAGDYICAYDGGLGVRTRFRTGLNCGIHAKTLIDLLKTSELKEVSFDQSDNTTVILQMGKSKVKLAALESESFFGTDDGKNKLWRFGTALPKKEQPLRITEELLAGLNTLSIISMSKPTQPMHYGVTLIPNGKKLDLFATDSRSIAYISIKGGYEQRCILPWPFIERLGALIKPDDAFCIVPGSNYLMAKGETATIYSNLIEDAEKPDLPGTVGKHLQSAGEPIAIPPLLKTTLERATILAGRSDPKTITISAGSGGLVVTGEYAMGTIAETLPADYHPKITASFDAEMILRGLDKATGFVIAPEALILFGEGGFVYVLAMKARKAK